MTICEWNEPRESRDYGAGGGLVSPPGGSSAGRRRIAGIVAPTFGGRLADGLVPAIGPLFHQPVKLLALFRRQEGVNLLPRFGQLLAGLRFEAGAQGAQALLALGHDFFNLSMLLGGELQLPGEDLHKFPIEERGTRPGGIRRPGVGGGAGLPG